MLKSTHRSVLPPPLPPGWTEHKAPTGHLYYYNAATKVSTYTRPSDLPPQHVPSSIPPGPVAPYSDPRFAAQAYPYANAQPFPSTAFAPSGIQTPFNGGHGNRFRDNGHGSEPKDRPKHKYAIPNCEPWVLVYTKLGRRFVHNLETKESFWRFPPDVLKGVVEYDRLERDKKERKSRGEPDEEEEVDEATALKELEEQEAEAGQTASKIEVAREEEQQDYDDEYEVVEVTDSEAEAEENEGSPAKRQRIEDADQPLDFNEDDIAWQLAAMEQEGEDSADFSGDYAQGDDVAPLSEENSTALFKDLLDDYNISPYSTWDHIIENGKIIDDDRYVVLHSMKARRHVFTEWSREKIQKIKEERQRQANQDPKLPYIAFLQEHSSPKLYWPEFRRKYRKEPVMKDTHLSDKDREKIYREHISSLKLPESTRMHNLSTLLKSISLRELNRSTSLNSLPSRLLGDVCYISLVPQIRDPLIKTYISTLPPPPKDAEQDAEEDEESRRQKAERQKREQALRERARRVQEESFRREEALRVSKGMLREGEREVEMAMNVDRRALAGYMEGVGEEKKSDNMDA